MSHPLDGCWAKIERADENIDDLQTKITTFFEEANKSIVSNLDHEKREWTFTAFDRGVPLAFPVLIGEAVHNLRTALDHLMWALLLQRHPGGPPHRSLEKLQFPISLTRDYFKTRFRNGIKQGIPFAAEAILEKVQPYRESTPADNPLSILDEMNNTDKHRLLVVAVTSVGIPKTLHFKGKTSDYGAPFEIIPRDWAGHTVKIAQDGTEILKFVFPILPTEPDVKAEFSFDIAFEKFGTARLKSVRPSLTNLRDSVVQTLNLFGGQFPPRT